MTITPRHPSRKDCTYCYDGESARALRDSISEERFATYLTLARGDVIQALQLYAQNIALGAAFHGPLQALEVTLRNAVHNNMAQIHGQFWFESASLRDPEQKAFGKAKQSLQREGKPQTPGQIVAGTNCGFWVALFAKKYDATLWRTVLHQCFDAHPSRAKVHDRLNTLRTLRNRIVHHEPILQRNLRADHQRILWLLHRLSPDTAAWVTHHSRVQEILARPTHHIRRF